MLKMLNRKNMVRCKLTVCAVVVCCSFLGLAQGADEAIPVGTKITKQNWEQYKEFMPEGMQALFKGTHHWKVPDDGVMEVGPHTHIPLPKKYVEHTKEYSGQVKLRKLETGAFVPDGYVAGVPFPNPTEPDLGAKIFYNLYYRYVPYVEFLPAIDLSLVDRFGNIQNLIVSVVYWRLSGISDSGMPVIHPRADGIHRSAFQYITSPEQSKYTTQLQIFYDDVTAVEGNFVFVPSLRRALRLSNSARCSPILGTDWAADDSRTGFNGVASDFSPKFLERKKILAMVNMTPEYKNHDNYLKPVFWPKPAVGQWELRDVDVIDIAPTGQFAKGYCYSRRVTYVDAETAEPLWVDLYDISGKPYKILNARRFITPIPGTNGDVTISPESNLVYTGWDVQNDHISVSIQSDALLNEEVPKDYQSLERYVYPSSLNEIMK